jgi:hypothetical protein
MSWKVRFALLWHEQTRSGRSFWGVTLKREEEHGVFGAAKRGGRFKVSYSASPGQFLSLAKLVRAPEGRVVVIRTFVFGRAALLLEVSVLLRLTGLNLLDGIRTVVPVGKRG